MYEITRCYHGKSKNGKDFVNVSYFDVETGEAGSVIISPSYLDKLTRGIDEGKTLRQGYDRQNKRNFLYVK